MRILVLAERTNLQPDAVRYAVEYIAVMRIRDREYGLADAKLTLIVNHHRHIDIKFCLGQTIFKETIHLIIFTNDVRILEIYLAVNNDRNIFIRKVIVHVILGRLECLVIELVLADTEKPDDLFITQHMAFVSKRISLVKTVPTAVTVIDHDRMEAFLAAIELKPHSIIVFDLVFTGSAC